MKPHNLVVESLSHVCCCVVVSARYEVIPLGEFVDYDYDHVPLSFSRKNEWSTKVHGYGVPAAISDLKRLVQSIRGVGRLVGLTLGAGSNVVLNIFGEALPVKSARYGVDGLCLLLQVIKTEIRK